MKKKSTIIIISIALLLQSLFVTMVSASPDYDMLIIAPEEFFDEIEPLKHFKDATGRPSVIVTLEDIYSDYTGADKAEQVKKCIAHYESEHNIKYVMLVGDVDKLPIRYFLVQTYEPTAPGEEVRWFAYYMTDQYYADLYNNTGGFCTWNADGDEYYAETYRVAPSFDIVNVDGIDFNFDVIVGRVPASTETEVTNYVNKVIQYELETYTTDDWFRNVLLVSGVGGSIFPDEIDYTTEDPPYYDLEKLDSYGASMESAGYTTTKLYHYGGDDAPNPGNINTVLNDGAGFFTIYSHQNQNSFGGGVYGFTGDMASLANSEKLPVVFSLGCSPAKIGPIGPNEDYIDTSGDTQNYGFSYPEPIAGWTDPEPPNVLQTTTDQGAIPEYLLVSYEGRGSIAFIGSMAEALSAISEPASETFHQSIADGEMVLGEVWRDVGERIVSDFPVSSEWEYCRRWLFMNVFGDPSLHIGGLPDKPPVTYISGTPTYIEGDTTYVDDSTLFTLTATDDFGIDQYYYTYALKYTPFPPWSTGSTFSISGSDGVYEIWYYSRDTSGNVDIPIKSINVTLDKTPPTTTIDIGSPKYSDTYVTSATNIDFTPIDSASGVSYTEFRIDTGSWTLYDPGSSIYLTGSDGSYLIEYRSVDNLGNIESIKSKTLILDNTAPDITTYVGLPQKINETDVLWVKSTTEFTITSMDAGSGPNTIDYTLHYKFYSDPYIYTGPFTLPEDNNNNAVEFTIEIEAKDQLNNAQTETVIAWVDDRAPSSWLCTGDPLYYEYGVTDHICITSDTEFWFEPRDLDAYDKGVGVDYTMYRIDGIDPDPYLPYTPSETFTFSGTDGLHNLDCYSVDYLGNTEDIYPYVYYLDNTPPETTLNIGVPYRSWAGDIYVSSSTDLTLSAVDTGSGVDYSEYRIDGGDWITYTEAFYLIGLEDGPHLVEFYSVDNLGNIEEIKSQVLILDNTPPEINIELPEDGDYVYGYIIIEISATDEGSGVHYVEYSLDDGATWLPAGYNFEKGRWLGTWDTTIFTEGSHTILARAEDYVENVGCDETPPTLNVMYLEYEIEFSDSNWNAIEEFNVIFNEQKPGTYKVSTNPGSIYEIITITNTGTFVTLPELILDVMIPIETDFLGIGEEAFEYQGAKSVHVYLNGVDVTPDGKWLPDLGNVDVMQALAPGDTIQIYVHYEYSFKGEKYTDPDVSSWLGEDYIFETDILSAYGPSWINTLSAIPLIE